MRSNTSSGLAHHAISIVSMISRSRMRANLTKCRRARGQVARKSGLQLIAESVSAIRRRYGKALGIARGKGGRLMGRSAFFI